ncbi:hypothetical protein AM588_10000609 [Phytophthora nicotianae]|uniref:Uncharacterized protein n=1 Tax=Phytophthora nicotianae TaxID=4792 RepID=A0A0W8CI88_PHYNI|nr:hypothetical protein AM588_10000609 [Phytophthora nicotianae]
MLVGAVLSAITLLAFAPTADAHGNLKEPPATFEDGAPTVEWVTMIDNYWDIGSGGDQVGKFKTMAKEKGMIKESSSNGEKTPEAPATQATPAPADENPAEKTPSTEAQTTEVPSSEAQDTKCNAPARRLRKKISVV